jgi:Kef-type K+ transport system membrane component KefB
MRILEIIRTHAESMPLLAKFALILAIIVCVPPLCRRLRLPGVVGLFFMGTLIGPHGISMLEKHAPVVDFFGDLGKLLLMFFAGLETDLALFRKARNRTIVFGLLTTSLPLVLGTAVGFLFHYQPVAAVVLGSLLASHTLISNPIVTRLGLTRLEPMAITNGATVISDTLSLLVFAICVPTFEKGFSFTNFAVQVVEIGVFVPLVLVGLSRVAGYFLRKLEHDENAYFLLMLGIVGLAGLGADAINLPGIVGSFLAGLAVNGAVHDKPAKEKLEFFGNVLFIPMFFVMTGMLIDPSAMLRSILHDYALVGGVVGALLLGKFIAAQIAGRAFGYSAPARMTMWALTLPQVAATLAATLVAYDTFNAAHQRLVDERLLNVVLVLMLTTSILGPVLTEHFGARLKETAPSLQPQGAQRSETFRRPRNTRNTRKAPKRSFRVFRGGSFWFGFISMR